MDVDGARGIVLQEDLGDLHAAGGAAAARATAGARELYREAVDEIALLQRERPRGPQKAACFRIAFDIEKLTWELHYFLKHFLEGHRGCDLTVEDRATLVGGVPRAEPGDRLAGRACSATATTTAAT